MGRSSYILGAGMTGIAAGYVSGLPVFEAADSPGGICSSYYVTPGDTTNLTHPPSDGEAYRFEIGGGHWIFGGDSSVSNFIKRFTPLESYSRRSSVFFSRQSLFVPYPIQNHLRFLDPKIAAKALNEMVRRPASCRTMKEWLEQSFGSTLCDLFFYPFHKLYTAGLYGNIAPQDSYKSPVDVSMVINGALDRTTAVGYNTTFVYPRNGLDELSRNIAAECDIRYGKRVMNIDPAAKKLFMEDGDTARYDSLISTLPLNKMIEMTGLMSGVKPAPYSSVLVLNIGAVRGKECPDDHWLYIPYSQAGFHRVGFYSNVDRSFLPRSHRTLDDRVSIYVERAYQGGHKPTAQDIDKYSKRVVDELQSWEFVRNAEVVDPTWIDVAYTWSWPGSTWKEEALAELQKNDIHMVGRYGCWTFNGIAASLRDGMIAGAAYIDRSAKRKTN